MSGREQRIALVRQALEAAAVQFELRALAENTATSAMAAAALGCEISQIAKSVVFRAEGGDGGGGSGAGSRAVVAVLCGDDRADTARLARLTGGSIHKADAAFVKSQCGFEIGGVAPLAHPQPLDVFIEQRLQQFERIWAAAGSAYAVFGLSPRALQQASGGQFAAFAAA